MGKILSSAVLNLVFDEEFGLLVEEGGEGDAGKG
jgi:hypothetical protein